MLLTQIRSLENAEHENDGPICRAEFRRYVQPAYIRAVKPNLPKIQHFLYTFDRYTHQDSRWNSVTACGSCFDYCSISAHSSCRVKCSVQCTAQVRHFTPRHVLRQFHALHFQRSREIVHCVAHSVSRNIFLLERERFCSPGTDGWRKVLTELDITLIRIINFCTWLDEYEFNTSNVERVRRSRLADISLFIVAYRMVLLYTDSHIDKLDFTLRIFKCLHLQKYDPHFAEIRSTYGD